MTNVFFKDSFAPTITRCVLYARVSDRKQVEKGSGLQSQLKRCKEFARTKGYSILDMFMDDGISGGELERPGMQELLEFLQEHSTPEDPIAVIFDDITRFARGTRVHEDLRDAIFDADAIPMSPTMRFGKDADSVMTEMVQATVAQHFRMKNAETTRNRIRARWADGYYTAAQPIGYRYKLIKGQGKVLVPDEPIASYVREAFEGLASGRFQTATEVKRFFESKPDFPRSPSGKVRLNMIIRMVERSLYAGFLCVKTAGIHMQPAKHEALIDVDTWEAAKARLNGHSFSAARKSEIAEDFPLRGHVHCGCCGGVLTAGWSKSKTGKLHPYYVCQKRGCAMRGKSIRRDAIEGEFERLVRSLRPAHGLCEMVQDMLRKFWDARIEDGNSRQNSLNVELANIDRKIDGLTERLLATDVPAVISAYETQIAKLETKKAMLRQQANKALEPQKPFDEILHQVWAFLANPWVLWEKGEYHHKRLLLRMAFTDNLHYLRDEGFIDRLNSKIALPFKALTSICGPNDKVVGPEGLEPPT